MNLYLKNYTMKSKIRNLLYLLEIIKPGIVLWVGITAFSGSIIAQYEHLNYLKSLIISLFVMLSAAGSAVLNNYFDRDIDSKMERTKNRALASGKLNVNLALIYGTILSTIGLLGILKFSFIAFILDLIAIISYAFIYTFLKRKTPFSLIIGSISGALPPSIGYCAIENEFDIMAFSLFAFMFLWQPAHFLYLSIILRRDYRLVDIPVISVVYGEKYAKFLSLIYSLSLIPMTFLLYLIGNLSQTFFIFILILNSIWLIFNILYYKQLVKERLMFLLSNLYVLFVFISLAI